MMNQSTIDKLIEMRLTSMADALRLQFTDNAMTELSFEDRFSIIVDAEYNSRKHNRLNRLIKNAQLDQPNASIYDIDYVSGRKLNRA